MSKYALQNENITKNTSQYQDLSHMVGTVSLNSGRLAQIFRKFQKLQKIKEESFKEAINMNKEDLLLAYSDGIDLIKKDFPFKSKNMVFNEHYSHQKAFVRGLEKAIEEKYPERFILDESVNSIFTDLTKEDNKILYTQQKMDKYLDDTRKAFSDEL